MTAAIVRGDTVVVEVTMAVAMMAAMAAVTTAAMATDMSSYAYIRRLWPRSTQATDLSKGVRDDPRPSQRRRVQPTRHRT